jgi:xylan 1,4-beta-xylosidase
VVELTIDLSQPTTPFPHYWERCVGSCHAATALREDWRWQLKQCHAELGFQSVRFHGLLNDDMSVYQKRGQTPEYSFFNIDSVFDFLLQIGMKPFIELSFMPQALASGSTTIFHYRANVTPPRSYEEWGGLIRTLTAHLVARYGIQEVRSWFFEVWNEPNLNDPDRWQFWAGTQADYFRLYRHAAEAIKSVDAHIPVGGPATAMNAWIPDLIAYCQSDHVPLDFISTHHYPTDAALDFGDMEEAMAHAGRGVLREMALRARQEAGSLPLYYTEWNNSPSSRDHYHDEPYAAAFVVKTIADLQGLVDLYSFWTFSDIFEEQAMPSQPFHGGFGLLDLHGIPKPTFRAFQLLHSLGHERLAVASDSRSTVEVIATQDSRTRRITLLVYNHAVPLAPIQEEQVQITLHGYRGKGLAFAQRIDADHANPKRHWFELGCPEYPDQDTLRMVLKSSEMTQEQIAHQQDGDAVVFQLAIPPHGVAGITLTG